MALSDEQWSRLLEASTIAAREGRLPLPTPREAQRLRWELNARAKEWGMSIDTPEGLLAVVRRSIEEALGSMDDYLQEHE